MVSGLKKPLCFAMALWPFTRLGRFCPLNIKPPKSLFMKIFRVLFFFFNDTATTEIYTLSLHDALPINRLFEESLGRGGRATELPAFGSRSEEHTSELQSRQYLVCRLLLEKKKKPL